MKNKSNGSLSLKEHVTERIESILREIALLRETFGKDVEVAREAAKEAVKISNYAAEKALAAIDKRLEGMNEFRSQLNEQQKTFITRNEMSVMFDGINKRLDKLDESLTLMIGNKKGVGEGIGMIATVAGVVSIIVVIIFKFLSV
jgi:hypothetical protein